MTNEQIRFTLVHTLTAYDRSQAKRKYHNPYALGQYLARVNDVMEDIEKGADPARAIAAGFTDTLAAKCLKACKLEKPTMTHGLYYVPESSR